MAELGLIGTIIGIAGAGVKLSITLYSFSETVTAAPAEIKNIARDVSLTAAVLEELGANLKQDDQARLYSGTAVQTAQEVVTEREGVFREIDAMVARAVESAASKKGLVKKGGKLALSALERLRWPFLQPKMEILRGNLERLKSTLVLMLNVLTYARDLRAEKKATCKDVDENNNDGYQRMLLENLLRANEEATKNYQHLLKTIGAEEDDAVVRGQAPTEHSDPERVQTATDQEMPSSAGGPFLALARHTPSDEKVAGSSSEALPPQESEILELTMRKCLKHIESALLQFERPDYVASHGSRVRVNIKLEKEINDSRHTPRVLTPWVVLSIVGENHSWPEHDTPSNLGSDDLDMYASVAAVAIESIGVEDFLTSEQRRPFRHRNEIRVKDPVLLSPSRFNRVSHRAETLPAFENETETLGSSAGGQRWSSRKPWYSSVLESLPSPAAAMGTIQETVKNSGLFFGVEEESENPDTVLEYDKAEFGDAGASQPLGLSSPKFVRSPTFDDILKPPSTKGRSTRPLPVTSPEAGSDINLESTDDSEIRPTIPEAAAEGEPEREDLPDALAMVAKKEEASKEAANSAVEDTVRDEKSAEQEKPDAIDQLLKQWTTLYDNQ
ncbi:hypothetical protein AYL99_04508 [Fonsecaea erecta]|uniref:Fungal N-terminal domain-containing protein n=1 Tax=Fonsecaea erecta TaxID=1367422 RepID=A0A178ZTG6_9EURO|nr:hypothetical protein AYL99_04508 [Fonsecaea erecta]OAP62305.1 hypothetical protein AYL99_04508 [Fonsecaea erecta]